MNLDEKITYAVISIVVSLGVLTAVPPVLPERIVEPFSELGVLGPGLKLGDYPESLSVNESCQLYLYVGNHEGRVMYYRVSMKLGDEGLNVSDAEPSAGELLDSIDLVLGNEMNRTVPVTLSFSEPGFNRRLIFELNKFDREKDDFLYSGEWLQLWLNVTSPVI